MVKILSAQKYGVKLPKEVKTQKPLRVFINKNCQLEFTTDTARTLKLENVKAVKFAVGDEGKRELYIILCKEQDKDGFQVTHVSGNWLALAWNVFESMGYTFDTDFLGRKKPINFDLSCVDDVDGQETYLMQHINEESI